MSPSRSYCGRRRRSPGRPHSPQRDCFLREMRTRRPGSCRRPGPASCAGPAGDQPEIETQERRSDDDLVWAVAFTLRLDGQADVNARHTEKTPPLRAGPQGRSYLARSARNLPDCYYRGWLDFGFRNHSRASGCPWPDPTRSHP